MVLSAGMVHFLKIKKKNQQIYQNYLVALKSQWIVLVHGENENQYIFLMQNFIGLYELLMPC